MQRRTQIWVSVLPLLACLLAVRTPAPALRSHSASQQRHRIQRPARTSSVRMDGDHHHEEAPHALLPTCNEERAHGSDAAILVAAAPALAEIEGTEERVPFLDRKTSGRYRLFPPGRSPPISLHNTL